MLRATWKGRGGLEEGDGEGESLIDDARLSNNRI